MTRDEIAEESAWIAFTSARESADEGIERTLFIAALRWYRRSLEVKPKREPLMRLAGFWSRVWNR